MNDDGSVLTLDILKEACACTPASGHHVDFRRVALAGPAPRVPKTHMLEHGGKRQRKKWKKRLAPALQAEARWSAETMSAGLVKVQNRYYTIDTKSLWKLPALGMHSPTFDLFEETPIGRHWSVLGCGLNVGLQSAPLITMDC